MSLVSRIRHSISNLVRREALELHKRSIEAGGGGRRWQGSPMLGAPQQSILVARGPAKARAAALTQNNPHAARIVETWVANLVGRGWQALAQHPDPATRRALNAEFEDLTLALLPLAVRALVRDGEAFIRLTIRDDGFAATVLPADQIDPSLTRDLGDGARIVAGVEFDADDRVTAYHILPDAPGNPFAMIGPAVRVPARDVLHVFDRLFPGQVRGMPWLAAALLKIADADAASDAMLMSLKVQALMTGFIRDADGGTAGFAGDAAGGNLNVSLEPGAMRILPFGAEVTFSQPGEGLSQSAEFLKGQHREIAAGVGLTYEQLTGDLSGTNYSSARVGLLEFRRRAEMLQKTLIEAQLLRPLWRRWTDAKALAGEIGTGDLADCRAVKFVAPGWQWVDPLKEANAEIAAINAGLKSRAEVVAGRGRDIEELDEEIATDAAKKEVTK